MKLYLRQLLIFPLWLLGTSPAFGNEAKWCEAKWTQLSRPYEAGETRNYADLLTHWTGHVQKCKGTVVYEAHLATIYLKLDQIAKAKEILGSLKKEEAERYPLVETLRLNIALFEISESAKIKPENVRNVELGFERLVREHPEWGPAYEQAANMKLLLGKDREAVAYASDGIKRLPASWAGYRALAIALFRLGKYEESAKAGDRAHELRKSLSSDPEFMFALAKSYASLKNFDMARTILALLITVNPDAKKERDYESTLAYVKRRMPETGSSPDS